MILFFLTLVLVGVPCKNFLPGTWAGTELLLSCDVAQTKPYHLDSFWELFFDSCLGLLLSDTILPSK